jgi:hypothetical protein
MRWALATFGRDRHRGTSVLRSLLAERDPGYAPPESEGEAMFYALIEGSDLPPGVRQFPIWDGKRWRRLDYAWPDPGVGAEFDGWTTHDTREAFQDDRCRPQEVLAELADAVSVKRALTALFDGNSRRERHPRPKIGFRPYPPGQAQR